MNRSVETSERGAQPLRELIGADLPDHELEQLSRVDASLRACAARDRRRNKDAPTGRGAGACAAPRGNPQD